MPPRHRTTELTIEEEARRQLEIERTKNRILKSELETKLKGRNIIVRAFKRFDELELKRTYNFVIPFAVTFTSLFFAAAVTLSTVPQYQQASQLLLLLGFGLFFAFFFVLFISDVIEEYSS